MDNYTFASMQQLPGKNKNRTLFVEWRRLAAIVGMGMILAGCGDYGPDMKAELADLLSAKWQVDSLHLDGWEITSREPLQWHYRFTAKVASSEDLYSKVGILNDAVVLQPAVAKGTEKSLSGKAAARLYESQWHSRFDFDQSVVFLEGEPASAYGENIFIVGSAKHGAFLVSAEAALQQGEAQLDKDEALLSQKNGEWQVSNAAFKESVLQVENGLQAENQQLHQKQLSLDSTVSREVQVADRALHAEMRAQMEEAKKELDARYEAFSKSNHVKTRALQQQYQELRSKGLPQHEHSERYRRLNEQDAVLQKEYREQRGQAQETYSGRVKNVQQEFDARRARLRDEITHNVTASVEKSREELQEKSQQQQGQVMQSRDQLVQQREALGQLSAELQSRKAELVRQRALLEQLKTLKN